MTAALLDRKAQTADHRLPGLRLLVLARLAVDGEASRPELTRAVGTFVGADSDQRLGVDKELVALIKRAYVRENKSRYSVTDSGLVVLLDALALTGLPKSWSEMLDVRIVAKALGLERESAARIKQLAKPDALRAEILVQAFKLDLTGSASASRLRAALALVALERAFGNKITREFATRTGFNAKASRVLAGQLLKRPRDAKTDKRLVTFLAAEQVGSMKVDAEAVRTSLIRRWAGLPPEAPELSPLMPRREPERAIQPQPIVPVSPAVTQPAAALAPSVPQARPAAAARPDLPGFVRIVKTSASKVSEGWPGNRKALISRVYQSIATAHPEWGLSLVEFKAMLAECHRIGHVVLATADLKDKKMLDELKQSAISYKNTVWHQVRVEE